MQLITVETEVDDELITRSNVAVESQPEEVTVLKTYVPEDVYSTPFHSKLPQDSTCSNEYVGELIVKSRVAIESHPTEFSEK